MKKIILFLLAIGMVQLMNAQEEELKTKTFVTGYFALNGEFVNNLPVFEDVKGTNSGIGIAEASVLTTIRPLEKLKINSVITYKPRFQWDDVIAELSGEYQFNEKFVVKAGRFILPLHPANTQYYAPMNVGIALPIFVTNQALFPLNINGLNMNGNIPLSDNFSMTYDLSGGQYAKKTRSEAGLLGFFGRDGVYMNDNVQQVATMIANIESSQNGNYPKYYGFGGNLGLKVGNILKFDMSCFYSDEKAIVKPDPTTTYKTNVEFFNYGANLVINQNNLNIKASAWYGNETPDDTQHFNEYKIELYYGEIAYTIGQATPYTKLEVINGRSKDWKRATVGINYRPLFETTFKLEYHRYLQDYVDNFDIFQFSAIYSF